MHTMKLKHKKRAQIPKTRKRTHTHPCEHHKEFSIINLVFCSALILAQATKCCSNKMSNTAHIANANAALRFRSCSPSATLWALRQQRVGIISPTRSAQCASGTKRLEPSNNNLPIVEQLPLGDSKAGDQKQKLNENKIAIKSKWSEILGNKSTEYAKHKTS